MGDLYSPKISTMCYWCSFTKFEKKKKEGVVPIVAQGVKDPTCLSEDSGLIPALMHWVNKDTALPQAPA